MSDIDSVPSATQPSASRSISSDSTPELPAPQRPPVKRWTSSPASTLLLQHETNQPPVVFLEPANPFDNPLSSLSKPNLKNSQSRLRQGHLSPNRYSIPNQGLGNLTESESEGDKSDEKKVKVNNRRLASHATSMTVETETVTNSGQGVTAGSIKGKKSADTIKPHKKVAKRKPRNLASAAPSSKADIFAARVASALDSAENSSDSDETFIYESNPPEASHHPPHRSHSRTPSITSLTRYDNYQSLNGRRSMKFASEPKADDVSRIPGQKPSMHSLRIHPAGWSSKSNSRPTSPRYPAQFKPYANNQSTRWNYDGDRDDDSSAPLLPRTRRRRSRPKEAKRTLPCFVVVAITVIAAAFVCAGSLFYSLSRELEQVEAVTMTQVLVSTEEILFDLAVSGLNRNMVSIIVERGDLSLIAKSPYVAYPYDGKRRRRRNWWGTEENLSLGHIYDFDSALIFPSTPLSSQPSLTISSLRLEKPGNQTTEDGIARWERVSQHPFTLILRGTLKYQLPLAGKVRPKEISTSVHVDPNDVRFEA